MVTSEFGTGKIVACTTQWIVHEIEEDGEQVAIPIDEVWINRKFEVEVDEADSVIEGIEINSCQFKLID